MKLTCRPIFIIGVFRSGTTLLRYIIDSHSQICCPPETDFLGPLTRLIDPQERSSNSLNDMGFDREHVQSRVRDMALYFFQNYATSHNKPRWADKTPAYVDCIDEIAEVFPEAQFVMIYRHGFDQAESFTRKGTFTRDVFSGYVKEDEDVRIGATKYWADMTQNMLHFEAANPDKCFRMRYEDLCEQSEQLLRPMFQFLDEPWEEQVLEYYKFNHDKGAEDGRAAATRGFQISKDNYLEWSDELTKACTEVAKPVLDQLKYSILQKSAAT